MKDEIATLYNSDDYVRLSAGWGRDALYLLYDFSSAFKAVMLEYAVSGECPLEDGNDNCLSVIFNCPIFKRGGAVTSGSSRCGPLMILRYKLKPKGEEDNRYEDND